MFRNLKLKTKLAFFTLGTLLLISVIYYSNSEFIINRLVNQELDDDSRELNSQLLSNKRAESEVLSVSSMSIESDQEVKQLFIKKDREGLYKHMLPLFENIKNEFKIEIFEFYFPDGTNFLRMQNKTEYGDKGEHAAFFKELKSGKNEITGFDFEDGNLALRSIRPYYNQGKLIGYIEMGESVFHLMEELKQNTGDEFSVFMDKSMLGEDGLADLKKDPNFKDFIETAGHIELSNTGGNGLFKNCFNDNISSTVKTKGAYVVKDTQIEGRDYVCSALNLEGLSETHVAVILSLTEISSYIGIISYNRLIISGLIIMTFIIFLLIVNYFASRKLVDPLIELSEAAEEVAKGNLNKAIKVRSNDEMGKLAVSFNYMVGKLKESYANLEAKISQRTSELAVKVKQIEEHNKESEERQSAILNILEDLNIEKSVLEEVNAKDEAFLKSIGEGLVVVNQEGKVILASQAALKLIGYSLDQLLGKIWVKDLPIVEDEHGKQIPYEKTPVYGALHNKGTSGARFFYRLPNGIRFPVLVTAAPVVIEGKNQGAVVVFRDITKEEEVDKAKSEFISLASHQLRTPLSAIKWFIELLVDTKELTEEQKDFIGNISRSTERMIELVNALLNISRIESGRITVNPQPANLKILINDVTLGLTKTINDKKQQLEIKIGPDLPEISIDQKMVRLVYENMLTNAIKHTLPGGKISVSVYKKDNDIISEVTDNGLGIPEKDYGRIFDKFYRGDNAIKLEPEGTGLGLYLTKAIVASSGGKIWFKSVEGKGTTFSFSLPLAGTVAKKGEVVLS